MIVTTIIPQNRHPRIVSVYVLYIYIYEMRYFLGWWVTNLFTAFSYNFGLTEQRSTTQYSTEPSPRFLKRDHVSKTMRCLPPKNGNGGFGMVMALIPHPKSLCCLIVVVLLTQIVRVPTQTGDVFRQWHVSSNLNPQPIWPRIHLNSYFEKHKIPIDLR